ncbi:MAG TPA: FAD-dependent thymidylate synthase [Blattabacteriaceae bacterium]
MNKGYEIKVLDKGYVRYIDHMGSDERIVEAARISYKSPSKGEEADKKLLHYLIKNKHTSPLEMCKITFNIKMPIFVMRQFVRHRMQNINEISARYTELPDEFYIPEKWRRQDTKNKQGSIEEKEFRPEITFEEFRDYAEICLNRIYIKIYEFYKCLIKEGIAKEMARIILPVGIYTEIYSTWDLNNLLKYFILRDDLHAQWEHQQFAKAMKEIVKEIFPWTLEAYELFLNPNKI